MIGETADSSRSSNSSRLVAVLQLGQLWGAKVVSFQLVGF
jgi:hypothetical protein